MEEIPFELVAWTLTEVKRGLSGDLTVVLR